MPNNVRIKSQTGCVGGNRRKRQAVSLGFDECRVNAVCHHIYREIKATFIRYWTRHTATGWCAAIEGPGGKTPRMEDLVCG